MSLDKLESQIEALRAQAESVQKRWADTRGRITNDKTLTEIGKQEKLDNERQQVSTKLSDLRKQETELIAAQKRSLEKSLFGLGIVDSCDTSKIMSYRDAQDRVGRLERAAEADELLASAMRSDDKILATAVLAKALASDWRKVVDEYVKQNPRSGDDLKDLAALQGYTPLAAGFSYMTT